jgi:hypothetical protein
MGGSCVLSSSSSKMLMALRRFRVRSMGMKLGRGPRQFIYKARAAAPPIESSMYTAFDFSFNSALAAPSSPTEGLAMRLPRNAAPPQGPVRENRFMFCNSAYNSPTNLVPIGNAGDGCGGVFVERQKKDPRSLVPIVTMAGGVATIRPVPHPAASVAAMESTAMEVTAPESPTTEEAEEEAVLRELAGLLARADPFY